VAPKQKGFGVLKTGVITGFCKVTLEGKMVVQLLITKLKIEK
jgi:predicted ATP-grasp superfamily ATP-dependent carboligase